MVERRSKAPPSSGEHEHAHRHLARLYEISKMLARFETVERTFPNVLELASQLLDLRIAILVDALAGRPRTFIWHASDVSPAELRKCREVVRDQYAYLASEVPPQEWVLHGDDADASHSSLMGIMGRSRGRKVSRVTLPLSVGQGPVFGALRAHCRWPLDEVDLAFLNALANQTAVALDRHEARRRESLLRLEAESARAVAQEAVKARDAFIAVASHELRSPLGALMLQLALLSRAPCVTADEAVAAKVAGARRQVTRLKSLVDKLLDVSRVTSGRLDLQLDRVDLREVVEEVLARNRDELAEARCPLTLVAPTEIVGRWDRMRLDQVVTNLLSNATKYGRGKPIEVILESDPETARVSVRDHGVGMSPADQEKLFTRFERVGEPHRIAGLGLGLWIVRQIVERMSGTVSVASRVGEGSTFTVELPRDRETSKVA